MAEEGIKSSAEVVLVPLLINFFAHGTYAHVASLHVPQRAYTPRTRTGQAAGGGLHLARSGRPNRQHGGGWVPTRERTIRIEYYDDCNPAKTQQGG
jgi:hypothetical protein